MRLYHSSPRPGGEGRGAAPMASPGDGSGAAGSGAGAAAASGEWVRFVSKTYQRAYRVHSVTGAKEWE